MGFPSFPWPRPTVAKAIKGRKNSFSCLTCSNSDLFSKQIPSNEQCVGRAFGQASHKVGIPFRAERDVNPHPPSLSYQALLQIATDAIKHLKFKGVARNAVLGSEGLGLVDDFFVMGRQTVIDPALH